MCGRRVPGRVQEYRLKRERERKREMTEKRCVWFERPSRLGPVPSREWGPSRDLWVPYTPAEFYEYREKVDEVSARVHLNFLKVAERVHRRRLQFGRPPKDQDDILRALWGALNRFCGAPLAMMEAAAEWAAFRRRLEMDEPLGEWDQRTATLGLILQELHWTEEHLLSP